MTFGKAITLLSSDQPPSTVHNGTVEDFSRKQARKESGRRRGGTDTGKDIGQDGEHRDVMWKGDKERQGSPALYVKVD